MVEGNTSGPRIVLLIMSAEQKSKNYSKIKDGFRPAHADFTYQPKYGFRDDRGGGRSSARETAMRVAAGAIAKKWLSERYGVSIRGCLSALGPLAVTKTDWDLVETNPFFCGDRDLVPKIEDFMTQIRRDGDSIGAKLEVHAEGLPPGWGEPIFDRLDADIASAMMGITPLKVSKLVQGLMWSTSAAVSLVTSSAVTGS